MTTWKAEYAPLSFRQKGLEQNNGSLSCSLFAPFRKVLQVRNELREKKKSFQGRKKGEYRNLETCRVENAFFSQSLAGK